MDKIIGIDLGTTNTCVAIMEGNTPVVIPNNEGGRTTPSIVSFAKNDDGGQKVGMPAKRQAITNPKNTIYSVKRFMGRSHDSIKDFALKMPYEVVSGKNGMSVIRIKDRNYTPQELSAMVLNYIKVQAQNYFSQGKVTKAVITVPAYFDDQARQATKEAGEIAGLEVVRIINEPTAAALAYGLDKRDKNMKVAVYDFGGGTFDISILECEGGVFEVKATNGDVNLGGDNIDEQVMLWIIKKFKQKEGIDLSKGGVEVLQRLKEAAEEAKKELSSSLKTEINLPYITASQEGPKHLHFELSRAEFEKICDDFFQRTLVPCAKVIEDSGLKVEEIDEVVLVGGSTRIPKVQSLVENFFKRKPCKGVNPDEVVAFGAAIQGGVLSGEVKGIVLLDVTPLSLGIETLGGIFTKLIEANTAIPTKKSETFSTAQDGQTSVDIKVYQGERPMARENKLLGAFQVDGIPPAPRGMPQIEVTFDIDVNGIVCVSAKDKESGRAQNIRIEDSSTLSKEEIERMKKEAEKYAEADKQEKEKIEKLNRADNMIFQMEKELREHGDKLSDEKKKQTEEMVAKLKKAYEKKDLAELEKLAKEQDKLWREVLVEIAKKQAEQTEAEQKKEEKKVQDADFEEVKKKTTDKK